MMNLWIHGAKINMHPLKFMLRVYYLLYISREEIIISPDGKDTVETRWRRAPFPEDRQYHTKLLVSPLPENLTGPLQGGLAVALLQTPNTVPTFHCTPHPCCDHLWPHVLGSCLCLWSIFHPFPTYCILSTCHFNEWSICSMCCDKLKDY